jgi:CelD/BcsL family acetyltransferase involved in cellulose biosynthesis
VTAMLAPATRTLRAYWRPLVSLSALADEWRDLAKRALQPNVFYEPDFALAAAEAFGSDAGAVLVRSTDGVLRGFFPAHPEPYRYGMMSGVIAGWTHPYAPLGLPLVDRDRPEDTLHAWIDHLAGEQGMRFLLLPYVPEHGSFATALGGVMQQRELANAAFGSHARALLEPGSDRAGYMEAATSAKLRKELGRKKRRLADLGEVAHESASDAFSVGTFVQDFLALEEKGWKGRAGSAAAQTPAIRQFLQNAVTGLARRGLVRADRLSVSGQPTAVTLLLRSGASAWLWKIAYDESFARFSPGVLLTRDVTEALLKDESIAATDSCATPDHPMIDHLWRERLVLSDLLISLRPGDSVRFGLACNLETLRRITVGAAKSIRNTLVRPARAADGG